MGVDDEIARGEIGNHWERRYRGVMDLLTEVQRELVTAQREVSELRAVYAALRQTSADLCVVCGWRFFVPGVGCHGCERARLAGEVDDLLLQRSEHLNDNMHAHSEGIAEGERRERAAVVAWLRSESFIMEYRRKRNLGRHMVDVATEGIERGEHRSEEE